MEALTPTSKFTFKEVELRTGDHIAFETNDVPLPHVEAAFTHVDDEGRMCVFSTILTPFRHSGIFSPENVGRITVVRHGDEAVPTEARRRDGIKLCQGQHLTCVVGDKEHAGVLIAAFDGVTVIWDHAINNFVTGGANGFVPA